MLPVATELRQKAIRLQREAQGHKAASRWHRDRAREKKQQLDELIVACAKRGIQITINNAQPHQGGHGGNQNQEHQKQVTAVPGDG